MSAAQARARAALGEIAAEAEVGEFLGSRPEADGVTSYLWACRKPGYPDWQWTVTLAEFEEPSVLELELLPTDASVLAPEWVPWSVRLAEYRAAQREAAQADASDAESDDRPARRPRQRRRVVAGAPEEHDGAHEAAAEVDAGALDLAEPGEEVFGTDVAPENGFDDDEDDDFDQDDFDQDDFDDDDFDEEDPDDDLELHGVTLPGEDEEALGSEP